MAERSKPNTPVTRKTEKGNAGLKTPACLEMEYDEGTGMPIAHTDSHRTFHAPRVRVKRQSLSRNMNGFRISPRTVLWGILLFGSPIVFGYAVFADESSSGRVADTSERADSIHQVNSSLFSTTIRPLLARRCFECHGPDEETRESDLRLDQQESAHADRGAYSVIDAFNPEESELILRVISDDPDLVMPPPETGYQLTEMEIQQLREWIDAGGEFEKHWAFLSPQAQSAPTVEDSGWCTNDIDRFVLHRMEREGLSPQSPADRRRLVRRLSLDLLGVTPDPDEVKRFVEDDHPAAVQRLVGRLLASPQYGEKFASTWLDLARYSDTNGYEKDRPRSIWPYRDWVIEALNHDIPYDQFSIEQLAGDMLPEATLKQRVATGFHRNTMLNEEGGIDPQEYRFYALVDRVATTGTIWMGMTIGCARCHTHKFDPIQHDEYYGLMALFNQADEPDLIVPHSEADEERSRLQNQVRQLTRRLAEQLLLPFEKWQDRESHASTEIHKAFEAWVLEQMSQARSWRVLELDHYESTMPKLSVSEDGAILARGDVTKRDIYRLSFPIASELMDSNALRLEVLPDASLPEGGPGMAFYEGRRGDFFLSELQVRLNGKPIQLIDASHSYGKISVGSGNANASNVIDSDGSTGWSTAGREGKASQLVVHFAEPLKESGELEVEMLFERHFAAALGKFRISLATGTQPAKAVTTPSEWATWLFSTQPHQLTKDQYSKLSEHFILESTLLQTHRKEIHRLSASMPKPVRTLVMQERAQLDHRETFRRHRGEYLQPRNQVHAGIPNVFHSAESGVVENRLDLAKWLVSQDNPLGARVAVNRAWREFFGSGLLRTAGDFGTQSEQPSHPELLDHLAVRFMKHDWSVKLLHRHIALSSVYRQALASPPELDPENRWLSVFPSRRMTGEVLRDALLSASDSLVGTMGGPSVYPPQPASVMQLAYGAPVWDVSRGEDRFRRSLYTFKKRTAPFAAFSTFDSPSGEVCTARRDTSTTPLQALTLLNDPMFLEIADLLALKVESELGAAASDVERVQRLFERLLVRMPTESETAMMIEFAEEMSSNQNRWRLVARAIMNLDEAITVP